MVFEEESGTVRVPALDGAMGRPDNCKALLGLLPIPVPFALDIVDAAPFVTQALLTEFRHSASREINGHAQLEAELVLGCAAVEGVGGVQIDERHGVLLSGEPHGDNGGIGEINLGRGKGDAVAIYDDPEPSVPQGVVVQFDEPAEFCFPSLVIQNMLQDRFGFHHGQEVGPATSRSLLGGA